MDKLGTRLARLALSRGQTAYTIARSAKAFGEPLTPEQVTTCFETGSTLRTARLVAARLGRTIRVTGWHDRKKARAIDLAAASGLSEAAARGARAALNYLTGAPDGIHVASLEALAATHGGGLELVGGLDNG